MMSRWPVAGLGVLAVLSGVVWTLQGLGYLGGSTMTGVRFWAVAGPVVALAGLVLVGVALRPRRPGQGS
jgi:hypothetical protein